MNSIWISIRVNISNLLFNWSWAIHPSQTRKQHEEVDNQMKFDRRVMGEAFELRQTVNPMNVMIHRNMMEIKP